MYDFWLSDWGFFCGACLGIAVVALICLIAYLMASTGSGSPYPPRGSRYFTKHWWVK